MKQEEKEQRLIGFASNFISLNDKRPHKQHYTESELADYMIYFAKSEAAKAYHQQTEMVNCECGHVVPLEFAYQDSEANWTCAKCQVEYLDELLKPKTELVNLDDIDKLFNSMLEWVDDEFNKNLFLESFNYIKSKTK